MTDELSIRDQLKANAEQVVSIARQQLDVEIGYDERGVRWLDGFIQRQHEQGDPRLRGGLANTFGAYLGECIIHAYGGEWAQNEGHWCIRFDDSNAVFPLAKVAKQLEKGAEDSVLSLFTAIPVVFKNVLRT